MRFLDFRRGRVIGLVVVITVLAGFAVLPAFGDGPPDADHLRMTDDDGDTFFYNHSDPSAPTVQPLNVKKCVISPPSGPLVSLSASPGGVKPGIFDHGMGGKSGGATGTPCSETSGSEKLSITSTAASWFKLRLDVEAKGNAWIIVDLIDADDAIIQTHQLLTGNAIAEWNTTHPGDIKTPSMDLPANPYSATTTKNDSDPAKEEQVGACADPNDSGPDSNINDNCLWTIEAGQVFTTVEIHIKSGNTGAVSLEGGNDYKASFPVRYAAGDFDSLFFRASAPTAVDDDFYSVDEDQTLIVDAATGVLDNDSDDLGQPLTAVLNSDVSNGTLTLNGDGSFTYIPNANYNGTDSFTYVATAGGQTSDPATATITINPVNDPPVAVDGPLDAIEDETATFTVDELGSDIDGDVLTIESASAVNGVATVNQSGELEYTPAEDFCGTELLELTFTIDDGNGGSDTATVAVNVACQADDDVYDMGERVQQGGVGVLNTLTVAAPGVLANDTDDPSSLTPTVKTAPITGNVTLNGDGSFTYMPTARTWVGDETSYDDVWEYQYTESGQTQSAMVTITIKRNLCQTDTVSAIGTKVSGSFTLLSSDGCKNWVPVTTNDGAESVLFQPDSPGTTGVYDGTLEIKDVIITDGTLSEVILRYDPAGGTNFQPVPSCVADAAGDPVLPGGATTGWCFYDVDPTLSGTDGGGNALWDIVWKVRGEDDPNYVFK